MTREKHHQREQRLSRRANILGMDHTAGILTGDPRMRVTVGCSLVWGQPLRCCGFSYVISTTSPHTHAGPRMLPGSSPAARHPTLKPPVFRSQLPRGYNCPRPKGTAYTILKARLSHEQLTTVHLHTKKGGRGEARSLHQILGTARRMRTRGRSTLPLLFFPTLRTPSNTSKLEYRKVYGGFLSGSGRVLVWRPNRG